MKKTSKTIKVKKYDIKFLKNKLSSKNNSKKITRTTSKRNRTFNKKDYI